MKHLLRGGGGGVGDEYESKRTLTRTKWLQVKTFRERDSGEGEQWEVAVETKAHGRKLILAAKKKRSKQNEITMNRLLLWKNVFFAPSLPQSKDHFAMETRLNIRMQLFIKTKNSSFKLRSLLSINQYSRRIPQRFWVFMAYVDK